MSIFDQPYAYVSILRSSLPVEVTARSRATDIRELRQARKGAAVTVLNVCRGSAWLSLVPAILLDGVARIPTSGVAVFFQDLDILNVCLHP